MLHCSSPPHPPSLCLFACQADESFVHALQPYREVDGGVLLLKAVTLTVNTTLKDAPERPLLYVSLELP